MGRTAMSEHCGWEVQTIHPTAQRDCLLDGTFVEFYLHRPNELISKMSYCRKERPSRNFTYALTVSSIGLISFTLYLVFQLAKLYYLYNLGVFNISFKITSS